MAREYQYNFSSNSGGMYDVTKRERKAKTMRAVLDEFMPVSLESLQLLNVGGSTGIIDNYLADYFQAVTSIDIDEAAVKYAQEQFKKDNLSSQVGDALNMQFADNSFDVVICSQIYEHVPNPEKLLAEIFRVLIPGGICYFAASNRLMWNEPHYNLPLLSVLPRSLAHFYVRLAKKADHYHELHYTYWGLKALVRHFIVHDFTHKMICDPEQYHIDYMLPADSWKTKLASLIADKLTCLNPGYIWLLQKPDNSALRHKV